MSNNGKNTESPIIVIDVEETETAEKKSFVKKGVNFVKTHKKSTIAVVALAGLVGASALLGRGTDAQHAFENPDVNDDVELDYEPESDTVA